MSSGSEEDEGYNAEIVADYTVRSELGRGGFSIVKEVVRKGDENHFSTAMKITPLALIESSMGMTREETIARLERMKKVSDNNKNPHIISFMEYRISATTLFTFGEVCNGGDLFQRLIDSPLHHFTESDAREAARNLLETVAELHDLGIVHRDIKPENIFYRFIDSPNEDIVLADFGCCVDEIYDNEEIRGLAGSPGYCAPEIAAGKAYNSLVDEWGCGITLYEMLTGRSPYVSSTPEDLFKETIEREMPFPKRYWSKISKDCQDFVHRLLEKDPAHRMRASEALDHPWLAGGELRRHASLESTMSDLSLTSDASGEVHRSLTRQLTSDMRAADSVAAAFRPDPVGAVCTRWLMWKADQNADLSDIAQMLVNHGATTEEQDANLSKVCAAWPAYFAKLTPEQQLAYKSSW